MDSINFIQMLDSQLHLICSMLRPNASIIHQQQESSAKDQDTMIFPQLKKRERPQARWDYDQSSAPGLMSAIFGSVKKVIVQSSDYVQRVWVQARKANAPTLYDTTKRNASQIKQSRVIMKLGKGNSAIRCINRGILAKAIGESKYKRAATLTSKTQSVSADPSNSREKSCSKLFRLQREELYNPEQRMNIFDQMALDEYLQSIEEDILFTFSEPAQQQNLSKQVIWQVPQREQCSTPEGSKADTPSNSPKATQQHQKSHQHPTNPIAKENPFLKSVQKSLSLQQFINNNQPASQFNPFFNNQTQMSSNFQQGYQAYQKDQPTYQYNQQRLNTHKIGQPQVSFQSSFSQSSFNPENMFMKCPQAPPASLFNTSNATEKKKPTNRRKKDTEIRIA